MKKHLLTYKWVSTILTWTQHFGFLDSEIKRLRRELKILEKRFTGLDTEKIELEKILAEFQYRHTHELGDLLLEILRLRQILYQSDYSKYEEAKRDEEQYRSKVERDRKKEHYQLSTEDSKEIKKLFRTASFLCHPDKVEDKFKEAAHGLFINLKKAYDANDLKKVREIVNHLKGGDYFKPKSATTSESDSLKLEIVKMKDKIRILENKNKRIKESTEYREIIGIRDWDEYFKVRKSKLQAELDELRILVDNEREK